MNKREIIIIVLFSVLGALLLVYFIYSNKDEKHYLWMENYRAESDQPYGTLFIKELLKSDKAYKRFMFNDKKPFQQTLRDEGINTNTSYVFIGQSINLDYSDTDALLEFVKDGNDAFIASLEFPKEIVGRFYENDCNDDLISFNDNQVKEVTMNFYHKALVTKNGYSYAYRYADEDQDYPWTSLDESVLCDSSVSVVPLGYQYSDKVNFFKIPYGSGNFYFHTNPIVFTNYFMTKADKVDYAAGVFSHLSGRNVIWDEYSKMPVMNNKNGFDSPLYYILQQPSLKYAWWLLLLTIVLYVLFAAKRIQRVIPVLEVKSNTSLEFVNLISALHFKNGNNLDMARKKMKYFFYFIRSRYGIHSQSFSDSETQRLAEKAKVDISIIKLVFDRYNVIERDAYYNADAAKLVELFNAIENFYKHCK